MTAFSNFFNKLGEQKRVRVNLLGGFRDVLYLDIRDVGSDGFVAVDPHTAGDAGAVFSRSVSVRRD